MNDQSAANAIYFSSSSSICCRKIFSPIHRQLFDVYLFVLRTEKSVSSFQWSRRWRRRRVGLRLRLVAVVVLYLSVFLSLSLSLSLSRVIHGHKIEAAHLLLLHCKQKWKGKLGTAMDLFLARACLLVSYYCITRVLRATKGQVSHGPVFIAVFASSRCDIFWCTSRA